MHKVSENECFNPTPISQAEFQPLPGGTTASEEQIPGIKYITRMGPSTSREAVKRENYSKEE